MTSIAFTFHLESTDKKIVLDTISKITDYQKELQKLKEEFQSVIECFEKVAKCLTPEDYEKCKEDLNNFQIELEGLCKVVQDCLEKLKKKLKVLCLQMEIEKKKAKIQKLTQKYKDLLKGNSIWVLKYQRPNIRVIIF